MNLFHIQNTSQMLATCLCIIKERKKKEGGEGRVVDGRRDCAVACKIYPGKRGKVNVLWVRQAILGEVRTKGGAGHEHQLEKVSFERRSGGFSLH